MIQNINDPRQKIKRDCKIFAFFYVVFEDKKLNKMVCIRYF